MIEEAANAALDLVGKVLPQDLKVKPEKQYDNTDKWHAFACWFTAFHMYFVTLYGLTMSWEQFRDACISSGGMTRGFTILDNSGQISKIAAAAGQKLVRKDATENIAKKLSDIISAGQPVPFSLNGEHYELCIGKTWVQGKVCFTVNDPGYQNDSFIDSETLEVFHLEGDKKVYSVGHDGGHRKITRVYWFEPV